jgi:hypothetical protein
MLYVDDHHRTWKYTVVDDWELLLPIAELPHRGAYYHYGESPVIYVSSTDEFIFFQNHGDSTDGTYSFKWSTNTWVRYGTSSNKPDVHQHHTFDYDPITDCIYLFGGNLMSPGSGPSDHTWVMKVSNHTWYQMSPVVSPPKRCGHGAAFDTKNGVYIVYGGYYGPNGGGYGIYNSDMWAYNPKQGAYDVTSGLYHGNWHQVHLPSTKPTTSPYPYYQAGYEMYGMLWYDTTKNFFGLIFAPSGTGSSQYGHTYNAAETWFFRYRSDERP